MPGELKPSDLSIDALYRTPLSNLVRLVPRSSYRHMAKPPTDLRSFAFEYAGQAGPLGAGDGFLLSAENVHILREVIR